MNNYTLNNGIRIPEIGFGTYKIPLDKLDQSLSTAYETGYRLFDTAKVYGNEKQLGEILKRFPRDSYFLTDKLWITDILEGKIEEALYQSLKYLKTDYFDLYLVHWPVNEKINRNFKRMNQDVWEKMIGFYEKGLVRAIGVSNFTPKYIKPLLQSGVVPAVDQIEYHPGHLQVETYDYAQSKDIRLEAWSPLARQRIYDSNCLKKLAEKYDVSISQIILRFIVQKGVIPIPKATSREHIEENFNIFDFTLTSEDMKEIENLEPCGHSGLEPDTFEKF